MVARQIQDRVRGAVGDVPLRRQRAERAVRELLATRTLLAGEPGEWRIRSLGTGLHRIAFVCSDRDRNQVLVRIAWTSTGERELEAEHRALSALEQVPSLESWRPMIPAILEQGTIGGRRYALERLVPGVDGRHFAGAERPATMRLVADAIAPMYAHTAHQRSGDAVVAQLLEEPTARLAMATSARERMPRLRRRLEASLAGRQLQVSRVHGDLWLGNAMLSADGTAVTGLVDWAASRASSLPGVDQAHLIISSRAIASGRDLGLVVTRLLDGRDRLEGFERDLLDRHGGGLPEGTPEEDLLLLAWLEQIRDALGGSRLWFPRLWLRRNVDPVLALV